MDDNTSSFWLCYLRVAAVGYNILLHLKTLVHTNIFIQTELWYMKKSSMFYIDLQLLLSSQPSQSSIWKTSSSGWLGSFYSMGYQTNKLILTFKHPRTNTKQKRWYTYFTQSMLTWVVCRYSSSCRINSMITKRMCFFCCLISKAFQEKISCLFT